MSCVKFDLVLPSDLVEDIQALAGAEENNEFIVTLLKEKVEELQKRQFCRFLEECAQLGFNSSY